MLIYVVYICDCTCIYTHICIVYKIYNALKSHIVYLVFFILMYLFTFHIRTNENYNNPDHCSNW